jgi:NADH:ubiquinone oxidoreductase subunit F (NADH-binding)/(2Fe-2S) ferredoxin/NAD-dependent dihydropyrimidine dehydrogenase PreA subunit
MPSVIAEKFAAIKRSTEEVLQQTFDPRLIRIQFGSATCENAAGALEALEEFRKHIASSGRKDIILHRTGCSGRCSCEPIVGVFIPGQPPVKYERVDRELVHRIFTSHVLGGQPVMERILDHTGVRAQAQYQFLFCGGERCGHELEMKFRGVLEDKLKTAGLDLSKVDIQTAHCFGLCRLEEFGKVAHVLVRPSTTLYRLRQDRDVEEIVQRHILGGQVVEHLRLTGQPLSQRFFDLYGDVSFFSRQSRVALRNTGIIDPESIQEYMHYDGFAALAQVLERNASGAVRKEITASKLRGRGGGGFPTGQKWEMAANTEDLTRYLICNADEGDPGAFMDRGMLEGDPFSVIEGMLIAGFAIGAERGFFYVRAEYPMAIQRLETAIKQCRQSGLLGKNILGSDFDFELEIRLGAGAFVCGEETALIHSIEGLRGQPRIRPPYPTTKGLWGRPTVINNVETLANVPAIMLYGADWFRTLGTEKSGGTKVFALTGKVAHTGLVEVPMGATLREIVFEIGGGVPGGKKIKAVQTGGPAGGCIPASQLDEKVDFESLLKAGTIMGSGGMIVMDEDDCMVDIAKFFLSFSQSESCGKCTPCREGTTRMLEIFERITTGQGREDDLAKVERLANLIKRSSLCGLGRACPNPVLSTLKHFRAEYEAHIKEKRCPAKRCSALVHYEINPVKCVGCTACARNCPVACISGTVKKAHVIDQIKCIKCGRCFQVCKFGAVDRK